MIIPRAKKESRSGKVHALSVPLSVWLGDGCELAARALSEMMPYLKPTLSEPNNAAISIAIDAQISERNEFYSLSSTGGRVSVVAKDKRGVINAIATLSQIAREVGGTYYIDEVEIEDYPDKEFRSFMIDTGRKYIPLDEIRAQILMMARAKMTKLHWHLTDEQGSPVIFDTAPGVKSPDPDGRKYTKAELREIVNYAAAFMIDVIPEVDMPGHSFELVAYDPTLGCKADNVEGWDICIGSERSYEYVEGILAELAEIFPYEYIHLGTDEIDMQDVTTDLGKQVQDWCRCSVCNEKFTRLGLNTVTERFYYFLDRVYGIVKRLGKKMIIWNDNIDISKSPDLPRDVVIEFWRVAAEQRGPREGCSMLRFLEEGYTVINADYPNTYIDLPEYLNWEKLRTWDLTADPAKADGYADKIIGAETCAWDVQRHYDFSLYTTVPAFADRVYNLSPVTDDAEFGTALTRLALGASVPKGFNMFADTLRDFILGYNDCDVFKPSADKAAFKELLTSLTATSPDQDKLISAYLEIL